MTENAAVVTVSSCSQVRPAHAGAVVVAGSYGGNLNAFNAARHRVRGVIMNDAGVGANRAGIVGLDYLEGVGIPGATADVMSAFLADGDDTLANGRVSFVNATAAGLGCAVGETVRACAEKMRRAAISGAELPPISEGGRETVVASDAGPSVICADSAGMLVPEDAGQILVTGSHAALFQGKPDNIVNADVYAIFFSDAGVGKENSGISRLADLDRREIPAATSSADSAPIGEARLIYEEGVISHVNQTAATRGARPGQAIKAFVAALLSQARDEA